MFRHTSLNAAMLFYFGTVWITISIKLIKLAQRHGLKLIRHTWTITKHILYSWLSNITCDSKVKQLDDDDGVGSDVVGRARRAKNLLAMVDCADANNNTPLSEAAGRQSWLQLTYFIKLNIYDVL